MLLSTCHGPETAWVCHAESYGLRIDLRTGNLTLLEALRQRLPVGSTFSTRGGVDRHYELQVDNDYVLYRNDQLLQRSRSLEEVLDSLEYDLELYVVEHSPERVFVHAGVVGWGGQAIVIPGRSFSGKSTLTAALCQAGGVYYSDEYALFDSRGWVHPYPRPMRLRHPLGGLVPSPSDSVPVAGLEPLPVRWFLFPHYQPSATWKPRLLTPGQALLALLEHTLSAQRQPNSALPVLHRAMARATSLQGVRGDTNQVVRYLCDSVCLA